MKRMKITNYILILVVMILHYNCRTKIHSNDLMDKSIDDNKENKEEKIIPKKIIHKNQIVDESFMEFYIKFNNDIDFQNKRIKYPLKGEYSDGFSEIENEDIEYMWTLNDSIDFNFLSADTLVYKLDRKIEKNEVIEKWYIENSGFSITSKFKKNKGEWFLVFYSVIVI